MKTLSKALLLGGLLLLSALSTNLGKAMKIETKPIFDIPSMAGKSPSEIEKVLGKPKVKTPITRSPEQMPGEFREYKIKGSQLNLTVYGLMVRYYQERAVHFSLDLTTSTDSAEEALAMAGIDTKGSSPTIKAPMATRWKNVSFNGVTFKDIAVLLRDGKFATVQATLE